MPKKVFWTSLPGLLTASAGLITAVVGAIALFQHSQSPTPIGPSSRVTPVPTTIGVFRPANTQFNQTTNGQWLLRNSNALGSPDISSFYGGPGDIPVVGHWSRSNVQFHR
jgi:hypothetical protein